MKDLNFKVEFYGINWDEIKQFSVEATDEEYNQLKARIQKHKDYSFSNIEDDMPDLYERIMHAMRPLHHDFYINDAKDTGDFPDDDLVEDQICWEECDYKLFFPSELTQSKGGK